MSGVKSLFGFRRSSVTGNEDSQGGAHFFIDAPPALGDLAFGKKRCLKSLNLGGV